MNIFKQEGFLNRLLGSSYVTKELHPKGSTPAFTELRECANCGEKVLSMHMSRETVWAKSNQSNTYRALYWHKSCSSNCGQEISDEGILRANGHEYKVPRLYDFVLWRSIVGVVVLFAIIAPFVLNWHGFGNVFVSESIEIQKIVKFYPDLNWLLTFSYEGDDSVQVSMIVLLSLFFVGILIQFFSEGRKLHLTKFMILLGIILALFAVTRPLPIHSVFSEGKVIPKEAVLAFAEKRLVAHYDELVAKGTGTESHEKAFALADKMFEKAKNVRSQVEWEKRRLDVAVMLVKAYPNRLDIYWEVVRYSVEFNELYLKYLNSSVPKKFPLSEHCQFDPWGAFSATSEKEFTNSVKEICENFYEKRRGVSKNKVFGGF